MLFLFPQRFEKDNKTTVEKKMVTPLIKHSEPLLKQTLQLAKLIRPGCADTSHQYVHYRVG